MAKTYDADSGTPVNGTDATTSTSGTVTAMPANGAMASIINIPPQIAVTLCWVALGFALCWYLSRSHRKESA